MKSVDETLSPEAKIKLLEIKTRITFVKKNIDTIGVVRNNSIFNLVKTTLAITITLGLTVLAFTGLTIMALWLLSHPLDSNAMYGVSIVLIAGYVIFLSKGGNNGKKEK